MQTSFSEANWSGSRLFAEEGISGFSGTRADVLIKALRALVGWLSLSACWELVLNRLKTVSLNLKLPLFLANSDPDQTQCSAMSDLSLHCFLISNTSFTDNTLYTALKRCSDRHSMAINNNCLDYVQTALWFHWSMITMWTPILVCVYYSLIVNNWHKNAGWEANSANPDQMLQNAASDLGLHCLLRPIYPYT